MKELLENKGYINLVEKISANYIKAKQRAYKAINDELTLSNLNNFNKEIKSGKDNETIGIILTSEKDDVFVEYATASITNKLTISEYQLYLPDKVILKEKVKEILYGE